MAKKKRSKKARYWSVMLTSGTKHRVLCEGFQWYAEAGFVVLVRGWNKQYATPGAVAVFPTTGIVSITLDVEGKE